MLFLAISNITIFFRIVGKMQTQHFNVLLFINLGDKVEKRLKTTWQMCPLLYLKKKKNWDLVPWIGGQRWIEMLLRYFSNNPDICGYVGELPEEHIILRMFSNPGYTILICDDIYGSQDLRVKHTVQFNKAALPFYPSTTQFLQNFSILTSSTPIKSNIYHFTHINLTKRGSN